MSELIKDNLARVREQIAHAAERAGRPADDITLIAVSKTFPASIVQHAVDAGACDLGENRVQEAAGKIGEIAGKEICWHLIGHLQSNKAKQAISIFNVIHSIDSSALVERVDRIAGELSRRPRVLIQVDLGHEETKTGADESTLHEIVEALDAARNLDFCGLMTLPPFFDDPERARSYFIKLRSILENLNMNREPERKLTELSMGMSHDFHIAIEEGATMIRVGTAIFGAREKH